MAKGYPAAYRAGAQAFKAGSRASTMDSIQRFVDLSDTIRRQAANDNMRLARRAANDNRRGIGATPPWVPTLARRATSLTRGAVVRSNLGSALMERLADEIDLIGQHQGLVRSKTGQYNNTDFCTSFWSYGPTTSNSINGWTCGGSGHAVPNGDPEWVNQFTPGIGDVVWFYQDPVAFPLPPFPWRLPLAYRWEPAVPNANPNDLEAFKPGVVRVPVGRPGHWPSPSDFPEAYPPGMPRPAPVPRRGWANPWRAPSTENKASNAPQPALPPSIIPSVPTTVFRPNARPQRRLAPHYQRAPGRGVKEKKLAGLPRAIAWTVNAVTETLDVIEPIFYALPAATRWKYGGKYAKPQDQVRAIYNHLDQVDWDKAISGIIENQIEDMIYGTAGRLVGKGIRSAYNKGYQHNRVGYMSGPAM